MASYALLDEINVPSDLRNLKENDLPLFSKRTSGRVNKYCIKDWWSSRRRTWVIELTIALHYFFKTPDDRIIGDVGPQIISHKILTGRENLEDAQEGGGISGFTKRSKSIYDPFGERTRLPRYHQVGER
ncbi:MAG: hypothetical protein CM15mP73_1170 [Hyphomicrobiales bacterium]|nr:MAG: hypothetical protein CM15mP73_1170 [Hyphomicrobiales bacterium]